MNKKIFTGLMAFVLLSGVATAQVLESTDFEDTTGFDKGYLENYSSGNYIKYDDNSNNRFYTSNLTSDSDYAFYNVNATGSNYFSIEVMLKDNLGDIGNIYLYNSTNKIYTIETVGYLDEPKYNLQFTNEYNDNKDVIGSTLDNNALELNKFYRINLYRINSTNYNLTVQGDNYSTQDTLIALNKSLNVQKIGISGKISLDNLYIEDYSEPDFSVSIPLPRLVESLGIPFGGLLVLNFIVGILSIIVALIPAPVFRGFEAFTNYVGGVLTTAQTSLGLATEYMAWIQTVGVQRLKEILGVLGIIALVRYGSVLKEGVSGDRSMIGAVEWIASDLMAKAESIERIIYRATDTLTNITHFGFYLIESIINIYKTIKNHLPLIG